MYGVVQSTVHECSQVLLDLIHMTCKSSPCVAVAVMRSGGSQPLDRYVERWSDVMHRYIGSALDTTDKFHALYMEFQPLRVRSWSFDPSVHLKPSSADFGECHLTLVVPWSIINLLLFCHLTLAPTGLGVDPRIATLSDD